MATAYGGPGAMSRCTVGAIRTCSCRCLPSVGQLRGPLGGVEQGVAGGAGERFQLGVGVQLFQDVLDVTANRGEADPEIRRNRAVVEALRHQGEDLLLAGGKTVEQATTFVVVTGHLVRAGQ